MHLPNLPRVWPAMAYFSISTGNHRRMKYELHGSVPVPRPSTDRFLAVLYNGICTGPSLSTQVSKVNGTKGYICQWSKRSKWQLYKVLLLGDSTCLHFPQPISSTTVLLCLAKSIAARKRIVGYVHFLLEYNGKGRRMES